MEQLAEILEEKKKQLINGINPLEVQFSLDEVNALNDKEQLALLRVLTLDSMHFCGTNDVFKSANFAKNDDTLGGILEYSTLRNPMIRASVMEVFPGLKRKIENDASELVEFL